jgi:CheY-specific phosphatase CheX/CheY-like chemotaxis protein
MKNVLLVDDDKSIKAILVKVLETNFKDQIKILQAEDGLGAIKMMENQKFDCVVTDINMPKLDGHNLIKMAKVLPVNVKPVHILVLSEHISDDIQKTANVAYMKKPFVNEELVRHFKDHVMGMGEKPSFKMDVSFINPFIDSAIEVIEVMSNTKVTKSKVFLREKDVASGDISSIVSMNSSKFVGSFAISFEKDCFLEIASNMLFEEFTQIDSENRDAASEICNQVFGKAKAKMNDQMNLDIAKAIPALIVGDNHIIKHQLDGPCLAVKFNTSRGSFIIEIVLRATR